MTELRDQLQATLGSAFTIERELGGGGMSRVFAAREHQLNREVVIKMLSADVAAGVSLDRFTREIQLAASLQQANIVPLLAAGDAGGIPYYTMPYVAGESLRGRLIAGPQLAIGECVSILRDVARALSYAHARGVVHRDIKPDNVLISHGTAMVTDFGIAKAVSASRTMEGAATLTQAGSSIGTPAYMAPEQVAGDPNVNHLVDVYAWGCLAYELLTGEPPFVRESMQRTLAAHLTDPPRPLGERRSDVPAPLARLVMRCLAKDPSQRPASADEILRDLDAVFTPGAAAFEPPPASTRSRRNAMIALGVIAVVAVISAVALRGRAAAVASSAARDNSIAVLPLTNLGGDKADDYFGIGLAEEMTRALAKGGVRVIGRTSAGALQAKGLDERAIARELGVGSLLTGSVQRAQGTVRISVTLSAADGAVRWTQAYDRPMSNVFAVQDEIAREVSRELLGTLGARPAGTLLRTETADVEAHSYVLQGIVLWSRRTAPSIRQAIGLFEQAIARDPKYARAYAWLALANVTLTSYVDDATDPLLDRAQAAAERAIEMDSTIAEAYTASAHVLSLRARNREAEERFRQALSRDSTLSTTWFWSALLANRVGDSVAANLRIARARSLEPASLVARAGEVQILRAERRYVAADSASARLIALDSTFLLGWADRAAVLMGVNRVAEALDIYAHRVVGQPGLRTAEALGRYAWSLAEAGHAAQARSVLDQARVANGGKMPPVGVVAAALYRLGDATAGVMLLGEARADHDPWMLQHSRSVWYDGLRSDARGAALLSASEAP